MIRKSWACKDLGKDKSLEAGICLIHSKEKKRPLWLAQRTRERKQDEAREPAIADSL